MPHSARFACLAMLAAALSSGCASLTHLSDPQLPCTWIPSPLSLDGDERAWEQVQGLDSQDLVIKAMNDRKFLYLQIGSSAQHIKSQLLGAFGQDFVIWFDSTRERRKDHGLSIRFSPAAGLAYPKSTDGEPEYLGASLRRVSILMPGKEIYAQALSNVAGALPLDVRAAKGQLNYELKLPLKSGEGQPWGIEAQPGQAISLVFESPEIKPEDASQELDRENQGLARPELKRAKMPALGGGTGAGDATGGQHHLSSELGAGEKPKAGTKEGGGQGLANAPDPFQIRVSLQLSTIN